MSIPPALPNMAIPNGTYQIFNGDFTQQIQLQAPNGPFTVAAPAAAAAAALNQQVRPHSFNMKYY